MKCSLTLVHVADHSKLTFRHPRLTSSGLFVPGRYPCDAVHKTSLGHSQRLVSLFDASITSSFLECRTGDQIRTEPEAALYFLCPRTSRRFANCHGRTRCQDPDMEHKTDSERVGRALWSSAQIAIYPLDAYWPSPCCKMGIFRSVACQWQ